MVPDVVRAHPGRDLIVRVNPRGTPWYLADLAAVVPARPTAVMLPKCSGPDDLATLDHHLEVLETAAGAPVGSIGVVAIVTETAASVFTLGRLCRRGLPPAGDLLRRGEDLLGGSRHQSTPSGRLPIRHPSSWHAPRC